MIISCVFYLEYLSQLHNISCVRIAVVLLLSLSPQLLFESPERERCTLCCPQFLQRGLRCSLRVQFLPDPGRIIANVVWMCLLSQLIGLSAGLTTISPVGQPKSVMLLWTSCYQSWKLLQWFVVKCSNAAPGSRQKHWNNLLKKCLQRAEKVNVGVRGKKCISGNVDKCCREITMYWNTTLLLPPIDTASKLSAPLKVTFHCRKIPTLSILLSWVDCCVLNW